jgi:predicted RNA-binding Zn-ribbon protein involved in translation (DUF1610 family)
VTEFLHPDRCIHPESDRTVLMAAAGCKVERCGACGFPIEDGKVSEFRTCPFCGDWFIDRHLGDDDEVGCQGCGAVAPADIWNKRV